MRIKPILFNTDMVRAILDGRKTVTRRVIKPANRVRAKSEKYHQGYGLWIEDDTDNPDKCGHIKDYSVSPLWSSFAWYTKKYAPYQPGDILYVRETWQYAYDIDDNDYIIEDTGIYLYYADNPMPFTHWLDSDTGEHKDYMPWRPSIHMPKEAARIWLKVTKLRVEQIKDITDDESRREGFNSRDDFISAILKMYTDCTEDSWVWVIEFERTVKPK